MIEVAQEYPYYFGDVIFWAWADDKCTVPIPITHFNDAVCIIIDNRYVSF